ncbi:MAG TPA: TetR family transcriptional regulator [Rhizomicrobium sp.]|nr:TetR family transcriptional regulator [Rhizomicrobium sp.]
MNASALAENRAQRRAKERIATRGGILEAARRVAAREGARNLSLRAVAAEAGFAPAALYGYFQNKDDLLLALAGDDLGTVARAMRDAANGAASGKLAAASGAAFDLLQKMETIAAAPSALSVAAGEGERLFNGRLIAALKALSDASGKVLDSREAQADVVLIAAAITGLAVLARTGRLAALGFKNEDVLAALSRNFGG